MPLQWQLDPALVKLELEGVCAQYGAIDVYLAPYVEGPRESKARNAHKVVTPSQLCLKVQGVKIRLIILCISRA